MIRAERGETVELGLRGRRRNYARTRSLGQLNSKHRYTARALRQHDVAGLGRILNKQRAPRGQGCARQGCSLFIGVALRYARKSSRRQRDQFRRESINVIARHAARALGRYRTTRPVRKERRHHFVAHGKARDASTQRHHFTGTIGHRDAAVFDRQHAADHGIVVIIERAGAHAHQHLANSGRGIRACADGERSE